MTECKIFCKTAEGSAHAEKLSASLPCLHHTSNCDPANLLLDLITLSKMTYCVPAGDVRRHLRSHRRNMQSSPAVAIRSSLWRAKSTSRIGIECAWLMLPLCCMARKSCSCTTQLALAHQSLAFAQYSLQIGDKMTTKSALDVLSSNTFFGTEKGFSRYCSVRLVSRHTQSA